MKIIGSQRRETLEESGYVLFEKKGKEVLLREADGDKIELWVKNDHHSGYTIEINGVGYEFVRTFGIYHFQMGSFAFVEPV